MKKIILALLLGVAGFAHAATPTNTNTPTPTLTPTATRTNTPVSSYQPGTSRVIIRATGFRQSDGITAPGTSAQPGSTSIWVAQSQSYTAAVFSTGTATARLELVVPGDYQRNAALWLYAYNSSVTNTVTVEADVAKISMGALTSTSKVYVGPATNVQTEFTGPLQDARFSRVWVPLSGTVGTGGTLKPGDTLNVLLTRGGTSGNLSVFAAEFEYSVNFPLRP